MLNKTRPTGPPRLLRDGVLQLPNGLLKLSHLMIAHDFG
jgi:hypothetical protein